MLALWHSLKAARKKQGFCATRARLQVQLAEVEDETAADEEAEVRERELLHSLALPEPPASLLSPGKSPARRLLGTPGTRRYRSCSPAAMRL